MQTVILVETEHQDFRVELSEDFGFKGRVYPIEFWTRSGSQEKGWSYRKNMSADTTDNVDEAECWFEFSYCWRGVWEGRVYFKAEEFWSDDLEVVADVWKKTEVVLKKLLKERNANIPETE